MNVDTRHEEGGHHREPYDHGPSTAGVPSTVASEVDRRRPDDRAEQDRPAAEPGQEFDPRRVPVHDGDIGDEEDDRSGQHGQHRSAPVRGGEEDTQRGAPDRVELEVLHPDAALLAAPPRPAGRRRVADAGPRILHADVGCQVRQRHGPGEHAVHRTRERHGGPPPWADRRPAGPRLAGPGVAGRRRAVRRRQTSASTTASVAALAPMTTGTGRARHASKGTNPAVHPISPIATKPISGTYVRSPERGRATGRTTYGQRPGQPQRVGQRERHGGEHDAGQERQHGLDRARVVDRDPALQIERPDDAADVGQPPPRVSGCPRWDGDRTTARREMSRTVRPPAHPPRRRPRPRVGSGGPARPHLRSVAAVVRRGRARRRRRGSRPCTPTPRSARRSPRRRVPPP